MSADQITYVLIAFIVTGIAILLLLAGALLARRGRGEPRSSARPAADETAVPAVAAPPPVAPAPPPVAPAAVAPAPAAVAAALTPETEPPFPPPGEPEQVEEGAAVTPADLAAAARRVHDPREEEIIEGFLSISPRRREAAFEAAREPTLAAPAAGGAPPAAGAPGGNGAPPDLYVDDATGLESRAAWDRVLAEENARYVRYRRPVGVVIAELDGLARFDGQFGPEASRRVLAAVGGALRRNARRTDRVAHVGGGRFLVMLPETDEIQAINYVERVRAECERWLRAGAVALHLSMGWASPSAVGELDTALRTAEERMFAERRRAARAGAGSPDA